MGEVQFNLEIAVRSDFTDIFEVKSGSIVRRGASYRHGRKGLHVSRSPMLTRTLSAGSPSPRTSGIQNRSTPTAGISFELELKPGEAWHSCLLYAVGDGETIDRADTSQRTRWMRAQGADTGVTTCEVLSPSAR